MFSKPSKNPGPRLLANWRVPMSEECATDVICHSSLDDERVSDFDLRFKQKPSPELDPLNHTMAQKAQPGQKWDWQRSPKLPRFRDMWHRA